MSAGWQRGYTGDAQSQAVHNAPHDDLFRENARLRAERDAARMLVMQRDAEIGSLKSQLTAQLELVEKQKQTIKVQSKKIRGPTETNHTNRVDMSASTSFNYQATQPRPPIGFLPPPLPPLGNTSGHHQIPPLRPTGSAFLPPPPASAYGTRGSHQSVAPSEAGPYGRRGSHQPVVLYGTRTPSPSRRESVQVTPFRRGSVQPSVAPYQQHPLPLRPPSVVTSQALVSQDSANAAINWSNEFSTFFALTEAWARNFCNVPTPVEMLPLGLLRSLKGYSSSTNAANLLSSSGTRYFLVAAQMNHWITEDVFRFHIMRGFSDRYDAMLQAGLQRQEAHDNSSSTNVTLRRAFGQAIADDVRELMAERGFKPWLSNVVTNRTSLLFSSITSLLAPSAIHAQAQEELTHVFREALRLAFLMRSQPAHYNVEYPTARPVTWFDARCMHPLNLATTDSAARLQRHGRKIKLAVTPSVMVIDLLARGLEPKRVVRSGVLLESE